MLSMMAEKQVEEGEREKARKEYLEHQYSPSRWSKVDGPDVIIQKHCEKVRGASKNALQNTKNETDIRYGELDGQKLDLFYPVEDNRPSLSSDVEAPPIVLFIHGGYWQELGKEYYSYLGNVFAAYGIQSAIVGYDLAPKVKIATIFKEIQEAVLYIHRRFPSSSIFVCGHSAGGHLAALLLKVDWKTLGLSEFPITGIIPISGIYDLRPIVETYVNDPLQMDEHEALLLSPMNYMNEMKNNSQCQILCLIGEYESPEFHRQSKEFSKALEIVGVKVQLKIVPTTDHFSVMHDFILGDYEPTKLIVDLIRGTNEKV
eukprot:Seg1738.14 transcript_id=Seg1738.14/GoldUCD/mRNA.D3Y31 product="Kynurenine formamidase" protein_id=Seg1738.14/GoldUCD/D3Y31